MNVKMKYKITLIYLSTLLSAYVSGKFEDINVFLLLIAINGGALIIAFLNI